jgi:hypothetical protein
MPDPSLSPSWTDRLRKLRPPAWLLTDILVPWIATRGMLILVAWLSLHLMRYPVNGKWEVGDRGQTVHVDGRPLSTSRGVTNMFSRWDAGWYLSLARDGYHFVPGQQSNAAFFPLYPLLIRFVHTFSPGDSDGSWLNAGILVSNVMLLVGLTYLFLLVRMDFDAPTARRSVLYALVFPTTLFFSAVYTESSFLAVTVACIYYARKGQWWIAGLLAGLATVTRSPGVVVALPLGIEYLRQKDFKLRKLSWDVLALSFVPLALAGFLLFMQWHFGNAFATRDAQFAWSRTATGLQWPWTTAMEFFRAPVTLHGGPYSLVDLTFAVLCFFLCIVAAVRLPVVYSVLAASCFLFTIGWGSFGSMSRYSLALFPIFVVLAVIGTREAFHRSFVVISSGLAALFMVLFAHWDWVG